MVKLPVTVSCQSRTIPYSSRGAAYCVYGERRLVSPLVPFHISNCLWFRVESMTGFVAFFVVHVMKEPAIARTNALSSIGSSRSVWP